MVPDWMILKSRFKLPPPLTKDVARLLALPVHARESHGSERAQRDGRSLAGFKGIGGKTFSLRFSRPPASGSTFSLSRPLSTSPGPSYTASWPPERGRTGAGSRQTRTTTHSGTLRRRHSSRRRRRRRREEEQITGLRQDEKQEENRTINGKKPFKKL